MARLKKDHSGYNSAGLYKKYEHPCIIEKNSNKSKKDVVKWCGGKQNKRHQLARFLERRWISFSDRSNYKIMTCKCIKCGKHFNQKSKNSSIPLHIELENIYDESEIYQIQIKLNGKILSFKKPRKEYIW